MNGTLIRAEKLSKVYKGKTWALRDIDLTIAEGEWMAIIGPSGSGKTTLLNIIGCLDKPSKGSIAVNGKDVGSMNQRSLTRFRRENIGLIFQQYHLIPYLSAKENVMLAQYFHSIPVEEYAEDELIGVGLSHRLDHIPAHLSGGEQQRVCVARALINEPSLLLADEPTGNLDQKNGGMILDLFEKLNDQGHTIVMVTHDLKIARRGSRIVKLVDGQVSADTAVRNADREGKG